MYLLHNLVRGVGGCVAQRCLQLATVLDSSGHVARHLGDHAGLHEIVEMGTRRVGVELGTDLAQHVETKA